MAGGPKFVYTLRVPGEIIPRLWQARLSPDALEYLQAHDEV